MGQDSRAGLHVQAHRRRETPTTRGQASPLRTKISATAVLHVVSVSPMAVKFRSCFWLIAVEYICQRLDCHSVWLDWPHSVGLERAHTPDRKASTSYRSTFPSLRVTHASNPFRWRVILLSPAEEEAISADLQGHKWYDTVRDILAQSSGTGQAPPILAQGDWRWAWVDQTLRRLERAVLILHNIEGYRDAYEHHLTSQEGDRVLYPPPPKYPLLPRGRASSLLHEMPVHSDLDHEKGSGAAAHHSHHIAPHTLLGPPYSLLVVNKDESNAFSYGFGPGGAGGVVVYTGFLDDILDRNPAAPQVSQPPPPPPPKSLWSSVFGGASPPAPSPPPLSPPGPTPEQTSKLATLLAHELSHLVLSHHIETLSKGTILFPSIISIAVDTIRSLLYPLTFVVGPFFGDALDRTLRMGLDDLAKAGESCTNTSLEIEADIISAR